ncbi:F-actin-monooxygenase mical1 isoform X1 [Anguilla rostrata]|uniref:F-actin-monooxygenase mical1 isoform X1 n=1 Tax=Anguilla rostrata TaxID=7938 RepID=UPI0030CCBCED
MGPQGDPSPSHASFDSFLQSQSCKDVLQNFAELCRHLEVDPRDYRVFYSKLKERLNYWKAKALWAKLDKRAAHPDYQQGKACAKNKCLVLGAGPCGLRTAIELAFLGAQVVLLEKRDSFSRNNVLHLWSYTIQDLRGLGAKKFYGKFCTGSLDHISIRQLQLILLKVALLLGVEVHTGVEYRGLLEPKVQDNGVTGWRAELQPPSHPIGSFEFDVFISAGGGRFVPKGFRRKELRGKLAIGITANFINHRTAAEGQVAEISGVARIYNQKFFQNLLTETGIDLENIVYYKDDTHYFVMTAKKKSLLNKGVLKQDHSDAEQLLSPANVNQDALHQYARDAAHFSTQRRLPSLEFARDHAGRPDVAVFDFTCMFRAENASLLMERSGRKLLVGLVGDCLVEPFWPLGTGIARGFLAAFDAAWMVRRWGLGVPPLEVIAERESIYQLLSQTTPENTSKNYNAYSINPTTRYPNINLSSIRANQVQHLCDVEDHTDSNRQSKKQKARVPHLRQDSVGGCEDLLSWCQQCTVGYERVKVEDLTQSWRSGLALCALIHHHRPALIDFSSLDETDAARNNQLAFDVAERELGVPPIMSGSDMAAQNQPDRLAMVLYLTQFYNTFAQRTPPAEATLRLAPFKPISFASTQSVVSFLSKLKLNSLQRRKEKLAFEKEDKERLMRSEKNDDPVGSPVSPGSSEVCYFCGQRVYVLERVSTEGKFFHRGCFTCHQCGSTLRLGSYGFSQLTGRFFCAQHSEESEQDPPSSTQETPGGDSESALPQSEESRELRPAQASTETPGGDSESALPQSEESRELRPAQASTETPEKIQIPESPEAPGHPECSASPGHGSGAEPREHGDAEVEGTVAPEAHSDDSPTPASVPTQPGREEVPDKLDDIDSDSERESSALCTSQQGADSPAAPHPVPAVRTSHLAVRVRVESCDDAPETPAEPLPVPKPRSLPPKAPSVPQLVTPSGEEEARGDEAPPQMDEEEAHEDEAPPQRDEEGAPPCPGTPQGSRPKQPLRKLQLTPEEKSQLVSLSFGQDSDSEAAAFLPSSSSPSSSSSASASAPTKPPRNPRTLLLAEPVEEAEPWGRGPSGSVREQSNRRSFRRKEEPAGQQPPFPHKPRSKFSPWNLSSPRLGREHRFGGITGHLEKSGARAQVDGNLSDEAADHEDDDDDDDDDDEEDVFGGDDVMDLFDEKFSALPSDPVEAQKLELMKMRTLERRAKLCEMQRFHKAQSIQRRLEEIEVTFKELEEKGVQLERVLRGEAGSPGPSGMIDQWIQLVHQKNALVSEESDLMVASRQLELEDKQSILEMELRRYMEMDESEKSSQQRAEEERVLQEMLEVVDMRNSLVAFLEEKRLKEINEQLHCVSVLEPKRSHTGGAQVHWA